MNSTLFLTILLFIFSLKGHAQTASSESVIRYGTDSIIYFSSPAPYNYNGIVMKKHSFYKAINYYKVGNENEVFLRESIPGKYDFLSPYNQCVSCKRKHAQQINLERVNKNNLAHHMHYSYGEPIFYSYDQNALYNQPYYSSRYSYNSNLQSFAGYMMAAAFYQLISSIPADAKKSKNVRHEKHRRHHLIPVHSRHDIE